MTLYKTTLSALLLFGPLSPPVDACEENNHPAKALHHKKAEKYSAENIKAIRQAVDDIYKAVQVEDNLYTVRGELRNASLTFLVVNGYIKLTEKITLRALTVVRIQDPTNRDGLEIVGEFGDYSSAMSYAKQQNRDTYWDQVRMALTDARYDFYKIYPEWLGLKGQNNTQYKR